MKTKIARHISPASIAIALFLAVALLTRGGTVTGNTDHSHIDSVREPLIHASAGIHVPEKRFQERVTPKIRVLE